MNLCQNFQTPRWAAQPGFGLFTVLVMIVTALCCSCARQVKFSREIILMAAEQKVSASTISRASNGDYFVAGSVNSSEGEAWAARLDAEGRLRWQFRYRLLDTGNATASAAAGGAIKSRFFNSVELDDKRVLLCGIKIIENRSMPFLVFLDEAGKLKADQTLSSKEIGTATGISCMKWGDGIAVASGLARAPKAIGWLLKIDQAGNVIWERYSNAYSPGQIAGSASDLLIISSENGHTLNIFKIGISGEVNAHQEIPNGDACFVRSLSGRFTTRVGVVIPGHTEVLEFDNHLDKTKRLTSVDNFAIKAAYELDDASIVAFGSTIGSGATASIAQIQKGSVVRNIKFIPPDGSLWFVDAVPGSLPNEFVTIRQRNGTTILGWVTIPAP